MTTPLLAADTSAAFLGSAATAMTGATAGACAGDLAACVSIALQRLHAHRAVAPLVAARLAPAHTHGHGGNTSSSGSGSGSTSCSFSSSISGTVPLQTVVARLEALGGGGGANESGDDDAFEQIAEYVAAHATLTKYLEVYRCVLRCCAVNSVVLSLILKKGLVQFSNDCISIVCVLIFL